MHRLGRQLATLAVILAAAGCSTLGERRATTVPVPPPGPAGYAVDPHQARGERDEDDDEERQREREQATAVSALENLKREADENGPPSAAQILRAHEQRKALVREVPAGLEKSAGLQPSQWQA